MNLIKINKKGREVEEKGRRKWVEDKEGENGRFGKHYKIK